MPGYSSYDTVGAKEDVADVISNISPTKTPFQSMIGNEKVHATLFEWQEDDLRDVQDNAKVEGFDATPVDRTPTQKRQNYTQILSDTFQVTGTNDAIAYWGRVKESAYQAAKVMAQLKRDFEHALVGQHTAAAAGASNTARYFASYAKQLAATSAAAAGSPAQWIKTGGASTAPTEDNVLDVQNYLYDEGADASVLMVTPFNSRAISSWVKASGEVRTRDIGNQRTLVNAIDVYVSPFGKLSVVMNRFLAAGNTLIFDPAMWVKCTLRPWFRETLAKTGDNLKMMVVGEFSLKHKNYRASGLITQEA